MLFQTAEAFKIRQKLPVIVKYNFNQGFIRTRSLKTGKGKLHHLFCKPRKYSQIINIRWTVCLYRSRKCVTANDTTVLWSIRDAVASSSTVKASVGPSNVVHCSVNGQVFDIHWPVMHKQWSLVVPLNKTKLNVYRIARSSPLILNDWPIWVFDCRRERAGSKRLLARQRPL